MPYENQPPDVGNEAPSFGAGDGFSRLSASPDIANTKRSCARPPPAEQIPNLSATSPAQRECNRLTHPPVNAWTLVACPPRKRATTCALAFHGLAPSPPFAPRPERWTLTIVPSIIAYSKPESAANSLNMRWKTPALTHRRNRLNTEFHLPNAPGSSRHCAPDRPIHSTASMNRRRSPPV